MTFEDKLRSFFRKHKPGLEYLAPRIAKKFYFSQSDVLAHLHNRYVKGVPSSYDPDKALKMKAAREAAAAAAAEASEAVAEEAVEELPAAEEHADEAVEETAEAATEEVVEETSDEEAK